MSEALRAVAEESCRLLIISYTLSQQWAISDEQETIGKRQWTVGKGRLNNWNAVNRWNI